MTLLDGITVKFTEFQHYGIEGERMNARTAKLINSKCRILTGVDKGKSRRAKKWWNSLSLNQKFTERSKLKNVATLQI